MKLYYEKAELPEVTTLSETTIDEEIRQGRFPKPRQLAEGKAWHFDDLLEWARTRPVIGSALSETELYRHFDGSGQLLYVGISLSTIGRLAQHNRLSHWARDIATITIERYPTRAEAVQAERAAIAAERPKFNVQHLPKE